MNASLSVHGVVAGTVVLLAGADGSIAMYDEDEFSIVGMIYFYMVVSQSEFQLARLAPSRILFMVVFLPEFQPWLARKTVPQPNSEGPH